MAGDLSRGFKLVTVWLVIGVAVFVAAQWLLAERGRTRFHAAGGAIELQRGADGHFHWPGRVNGLAVEFLVDTGATRTALPAALAERAGLEPSGRVRSATAGGTVDGAVAVADIVLAGGVEAQGLRVAVLPHLPAPLLGMDVLSRLHFSQQGGVLRIGPGPLP